MSKPCAKCKTPTDHVIEFVMDSGTVFQPVCEECAGPALKRFRERQAQFEMLLANGVSRERANEIMIRRIDNERRTA